MRILLDECVHAGVREAFPGLFVSTVREMGWQNSPDGALLRLAEPHFDVLVTIARNLEYQQPLGRFHLGFVIVSVRSNELIHYRPLFASMQTAVEGIGPGEVRRVG